MRRGIAVSPGVAVGTAYCIHEILVSPEKERLEDDEVAAELAAYESAREKTAADLHALQSKVENQLGHHEAAIFAVHEAILRDRDFTHKVRTWIVDDRLTAATALQRLLEHYGYLFARTRDSYLRDRLNDVRDVILRISSHLNALNLPKTPVAQRAADPGRRRAPALACRGPRRHRHPRNRHANRESHQPRRDHRPESRHSRCLGRQRHSPPRDHGRYDRG